MAPHSITLLERGSVDEKPENPRPSKRTRKQSACARCRSRKQGCDNQFPQCRNCSKAKIECVRPPESISSSNWSNYALRDRIAQLEAQLAANEATSPLLFRDDGADHLFSPPDSAKEEKVPQQTGIADVVGFLSLGAEPTYVGPSSGISLAASLSEMVQATVWNKVLSNATERTPGTMSIAELKRNAAGPPEDDIGSRIIVAYLTRVHPRYPFLNRNDLYRIHGDRYQDVVSVEQQFETFKLYMVYAIGSTMLRLTEQYDYTPPEKFFITALQHMSAAKESHSINNVIAMTLLVIYHLRSPSHSGVPNMIGLAMRTCIELGLHREAHYVRLDPFQGEIKRRLFWSVYCLDRVIAIALGRPSNLTDRDIDVKLPLDIDDYVEDPLLITRLSQSPAPFPSRSTLSPGIHLFRLKQIESKIQAKIYRVDRRPSELIPKINPLMAEIEDWKTNIPPSSPSELTYSMLQYHKAMRLLLQPFLAILDPSDSRKTLCLEASGQICQIFKRLHSVEAYGHSFVAVHSVFVAGVTICYCLWLDPSLWSFGISNDLRACSSVLHVIAERAPNVRKYRDVFEEMIDATMRHMEQAAAASNVPVMPLGQQRLWESDDREDPWERFRRESAWDAFEEGNDVEAVQMLQVMTSTTTAGVDDYPGVGGGGGGGLGWRDSRKNSI